MNKHQFTAIITLILCSSFPIGAAETEVQHPNFHVADWTLLNIKGETASLAKPALKNAKSKLSQVWSPNALDLAKATTPPVSLNKKNLSQTILSAKLKTNHSHIAMPVWCSLKDDYVFLLRIVDAKTNLLLAQDHLAISKSDFQKKSVEQLEQVIDFSSFVDSVKNKADKTNIAKQVEDNVFKLSLSLARESSRLDVGSYQCLNLLSEGQLLSRQHVIVNNLALEALYHIRMRTQLKNKIHRSTRTALIDWNFQKESGQYLFASNMSESVLGNRFSPTISKLASLNRVGQKVQIILPEEFLQQISSEKEGLTTKPFPKIAHIYGAWVYLDRGRTYGLKMDDRLQVKTSQGAIKGHVVGFYGPRLNLKSPRGHNIREGAIVFIRKGQRKTAIGQEFVFDAQRYPTPWPPKSSAQ